MVRMHLCKWVATDFLFVCYIFPIQFNAMYASCCCLTLFVFTFRGHALKACVCRCLCAVYFCVEAFSLGALSLITPDAIVDIRFFVCNSVVGCPAQSSICTVSFRLPGFSTLGI